MDILIIGNGFDLAHGLKTSYKDFLEYCKEKETDNSTSFYNTNIWLKHFITRQNKLGNTWIDLETEIYRVITQVSQDYIYQTANTNPFFIKINKKNQKFDFNELHNYIEHPSFNEEYKNENYYFLDVNARPYLSKLCITNKKGFIDFLYDQLREFTQYFEQYLNVEVLEKMNENSKYNLNINKDCRSLLSFNYTNTCEKLYKINFNRNAWSIGTQTVYIHGQINSKTENNCNLVLGTHSFFNHLPNILNEKIPVDFNLFKKHNQRHKFETLKSYQALLNELKYPKKIYTPIFHIIGHSLDKTDHNILKHILLARQKSVIKIYYHNEEAQERLINNITEIIGEEEVMAKVQLIYQHDPKRGILIPKKEQI